MSKARPPIRLSTGWLHALDAAAPGDRQPYFEPVDGVELSITHPERLDTYRTGVTDGRSISLHISHRITAEEYAPFIHMYQPETAVLHPDTGLERLPEFLDRGFPISIENMDVRKECGYDIRELTHLLDKYDVGFTLDVQHTYEHDPTMSYAWELVELAGESLEELHVSGERGRNAHALVHTSENKTAISEFLREFYESGRDVPMVIEGRYESVEDVRSEVKYLRDLVSG